MHQVGNTTCERAMATSFLGSCAQMFPGKVRPYSRSPITGGKERAASSTFGPFTLPCISLLQFWVEKKHVALILSRVTSETMALSRNRDGVYMIGKIERIRKRGKTRLVLGRESRPGNGNYVEQKQHRLLFLSSFFSVIPVTFFSLRLSSPSLWLPNHYINRVEADCISKRSLFHPVKRMVRVAGVSFEMERGPVLASPPKKALFSVLFFGARPGPPRSVFLYFNRAFPLFTCR